jgi:hypothetical protein
MTLKHVLTAGILCVSAMAALPATAMPIDNLAQAAPANVENVRWVCGPYRCWWRRNFYYAPRIYVVPRHRYWRHRRW